MNPVERSLKVRATADGYDVVLGNQVLVSFTTSGEAWSWIDRNTDEGRGDIERFRRIRSSPTFS